VHKVHGHPDRGAVDKVHDHPDRGAAKVHDHPDRGAVLRCLNIRIVALKNACSIVEIAASCF
jgi:hypothetical protein